MDVEKEGRDSTSFTQMGHSLFLMFTALEVRNQNHLQWHLEGKLNYNSATKLCFFNYMLLCKCWCKVNGPRSNSSSVLWSTLVLFLHYLSLSIWNFPLCQFLLILPDRKEHLWAFPSWGCEQAGAHLGFCSSHHNPCELCWCGEKAETLKATRLNKTKTNHIHTPKKGKEKKEEKCVQWRKESEMK